jgi:hypothetical protein
MVRLYLLVCMLKEFLLYALGLSQLLVVQMVLNGTAGKLVGMNDLSIHSM